MWSGGWYETSLFFKGIDVIARGNEIKCVSHLKKIKVAIGMTFAIAKIIFGMVFALNILSFLLCLYFV